MAKWWSELKEEDLTQVSGGDSSVIYNGTAYNKGDVFVNNPSAVNNNTFDIYVINNISNKEVNVFHYSYSKESKTAYYIKPITISFEGFFGAYCRINITIDNFS